VTWGSYVFLFPEDNDETCENHEKDDEYCHDFNDQFADVLFSEFHRG